MDVRSFTRRYWRGALLVPPLGALIGYYVLGSGFADGMGQFFGLGFLLVAVPYAAFAGVMWWYLDRTSSPARVIVVALATPFIIAALGAAMVAAIVAFRVAFLGGTTYDYLGAAYYWLAIPAGYVYVVPVTVVFLLAWAARALRAGGTRSQTPVASP